MHDDCLYSMLRLQLRGEIFGDFGRRVGGVVEDEVAAFAGEIASNCSTDTWPDIGFTISAGKS